MLKTRPSHERGGGDFGWLSTKHSFSFGEYYDPSHMGFRGLRVMNEDIVLPGEGFGTHPHRDMEIITCVLEGSLRHADSLGHTAVIEPGELQHISAGRGIQHSEFNDSADQRVHLYQIWIHPHTRGLDPAYHQQRFDPASMINRLRVVASPDGRDSSLPIRCDAVLLRTKLDAGAAVEHRLTPGRHAWVQVMRGDASVNGVALNEGDGLAASDEPGLTIASRGGAELLLFDLA